MMTKLNLNLPTVAPAEVIPRASTEVPPDPMTI